MLSSYLPIVILLVIVAGFAITMAPLFAADGFEAEIKGCEVRRAGQAGFPQAARGKLSSEPWSRLEDFQTVPGVEEHNRTQHRRKVSGCEKNGAPFLDPLVLVPVEVVDEPILLPPIASRRRSRLRQRCLGTGKDRIDLRQLSCQWIGD